jgi:riboflavin kinase/FMN adenylyltransferase
MQLYDDHLEARGRTGASAVTIGSFDGFHAGHQLLLRTVQEEAALRGLAPGLVTFEPHPARALAPGLSPPLLVSPGRKRVALTRAGLAWVVCQRFDPDFAALSPERFAREVLVESLAVRLVVVGDDFTFGRGRSAGTAELTALGARLGFEVRVLPRLAIESITASSTRIRAFLMQGNPEAAGLLLGRPYTLFGRVVTGAGRGRGLGYPTANLACDVELRPAAGVYACRAWGAEPTGARLAVASLGTHPTFGPGAWTVEPHLVGFSGELVGRALALALVARLREERVFPSPRDLVQQIDRDVEDATRLASGWPPAEAPEPLDGIVLDNLPSAQG